MFWRSGDDQSVPEGVADAVGTGLQRPCFPDRGHLVGEARLLNECDQFGSSRVTRRIPGQSAVIKTHPVSTVDVLCLLCATAAQKYLSGDRYL